MRERLNRAVSKTVVPQGTGGSNPPLSVLLAKTVIAIWRNYAKVRRKSGDSIVSTKRAGAASGEGGPEGANPPLSVLLAKTVIAIWRNYAKVRRKSGDSIVSGKRSFPRGRPRRVICYRVFSILERCPSGRRCTLGRRVCSREYRGFESPSLRTADTNCYNNMAVCALKRVESGDSIVSPKRASAALGEGGPKGESPSLRTYS